MELNQIKRMRCKGSGIRFGGAEIELRKWCHFWDDKLWGEVNDGWKQMMRGVMGCFISYYAKFCFQCFIALLGQL